MGRGRKCAKKRTYDSWCAARAAVHCFVGSMLRRNKLGVAMHIVQSFQSWFYEVQVQGTCMTERASLHCHWMSAGVAQAIYKQPEETCTEWAALLDPHQAVKDV